MLVITVVYYEIPFPLQPYTIIVINDHYGNGIFFADMMVRSVPLTTIFASVPMLGMLPTTRQLIGVIGGLVAMLYLFEGEIHKGVAIRALTLASITPIGYAIIDNHIRRRFTQVRSRH